MSVASFYINDLLNPLLNSTKKKHRNERRDIILLRYESTLQALMGKRVEASDFTYWPGPGEHGKALLKCNAIVSKAVMIHNFNRIENMKFDTSFLIRIVHKRNATFLKVNC